MTTTTPSADKTTKAVMELIGGAIDTGFDVARDPRILESIADPAIRSLIAVIATASAKVLLLQPGAKGALTSDELRAVEGLATRWTNDGQVVLRIDHDSKGGA